MGVVLIGAGVLMLIVFLISFTQNDNEMWWWVWIPLLASIFLIGAGVFSFFA